MIRYTDLSKGVNERGTALEVLFGCIPNINKDSGYANDTNEPFHVGVEHELIRWRVGRWLAERPVLGAP